MIGSFVIQPRKSKKRKEEKRARFKGHRGRK
jgi:hypothetical protein